MYPQLFIFFIINVISVSPVPIDHIKFQPIKVNWEKFYGKWYEFARVDHKLEAGLKCATFNFVNGTSYQDGHPYEQVAFDDQLNEYFNVANVEVYNDEAILDYGKNSYLYSVIATDYNNFAIVFGFGFAAEKSNMQSFIKREFVWVLARTPDLDETIKAQIFQTLADYSIVKDELIINESSKCPEYY